MVMKVFDLVWNIVSDDKLLYLISVNSYLVYLNMFLCEAEYLKMNIL